MYLGNVVTLLAEGAQKFSLSFIARTTKMTPINSIKSSILLLSKDAESASAAVLVFASETKN